MGIEARFICDGNGCVNEHQLPQNEAVDFEMLPDDWSHDACNDFCYCPSCVAKLIKNGELEPDH